MTKLIATLEIRSAREGDVFNDTIRIGAADRGALEMGRVHRFAAGDKSTFAILRGLAANRAGTATMDAALRRRLGLSHSSRATLSIREATGMEMLWWGLHSTDPAYAAATRLGIISFWLGLVSLGIALPWGRLASGLGQVHLWLSALCSLIR